MLRMTPAFTPVPVALPELVSDLLHGELPQQPPKQMRLRDTTEIPLGEGGWVLLGERPHDELALGLVGKFWRPVIHYAQVTPESFREFAEPGYAKTVYSLSVRALDEQRTLLSGVMRTATTDPVAVQAATQDATMGPKVTNLSPSTRRACKSRPARPLRRPRLHTLSTAGSRGSKPISFAAYMYPQTPCAYDL